MDIDTQKDFSMRNFSVLPLVPNEEYILSDPVTSETSLSSRLYSSMEFKPEQMIYDPLGGDKPDYLKKSFKHVKKEESEINFEEEHLTIKKESEWEDIGIEEELMRFVNQEKDSENEENLIASLNTAENIKRDEPRQRITSLHLQTSSPISSCQIWPNLLRDYNQGVTENFTEKPSNPKEITHCKTREVENDKTFLRHSQNLKNQKNSSFSRHPQLVYYQNTAVVPERNMINTHISNFKTSAVVSYNTDLLRILLQSTPSSGQHEKNKGRKKHVDEPEVIQIRDDTDDEASIGKNCDNAIISNSSTLNKINCGRLYNSNEIFKKQNATELEVIQISESSEEEYSNESCRNRVSRSNVLSKTTIGGSDNSDLNSNSICDPTETVTHDCKVVKACKVKTNTSDLNTDGINMVTVSHQNVTEDHCRSHSKKVKLKQKSLKEYILKPYSIRRKSEVQERVSTSRNLVNLGSRESPFKQLVDQSNIDRCFRNCFLSKNVKYSKVKQIVSSKKHEDSTFSSLAGKKVSNSSKKKERGKGLHGHQSSWQNRHSNSAVDRSAKKVNLVLLPISMFKKGTVTTTPSLLLQDTVVNSSTNSKELRENNTIPSENIISFSNFSGILDIASKNLHNSRCECLKCIRKRTSSGSNRKFVCQKCNKIFNCKAHLRKHISQVHSEEKKFVCQNCCKAYTTKHALLYHIFSYHNPSAYKPKCNKCRKYFANKDDLSRHTEKAHSKPKINVPEMCDICQKVFKSRRNMLTHKLKKHNIYSKKFICNDCSAVFSDRNPLIIHVKTCHMPPEMKCPLCSEYFPTKVKLQAHLLQEHGKDNRKSFICETCGKTMRTRSGLENHIATHSGIKAYVCEDCGKSFRTITNLTQHSVIHSDVRPFSCNLCDKSFRIRHHLKQHMAVHGMVSTPNYNRRARRNRTENDSEEEENSLDDSSE